MAMLSPWFCLLSCKSFLRLWDHTRLVEYNQLDRATNSPLQYQPPLGDRSSRPDELSLSRSFIAADNFPCRTSFQKTLDTSSTVLAFLEFTNFPCINLTSLSNKSRSPCFQRANRRSIAALCSLLLEVADAFCRIKVGSTMNAFKATEFKSESALNCLIQKVNSSMKLFPARLDGTLDIFFL